MAQKIARKPPGEGKHEHVSGALRFLARNTEDEEKQTKTTQNQQLNKKQGGGLPSQWKHGMSGKMNDTENLLKQGNRVMHKQDLFHRAT